MHHVLPCPGVCRASFARWECVLLMGLSKPSLGCISRAGADDGCSGMLWSSTSMGQQSNGGSDFIEVASKKPYGGCEGQSRELLLPKFGLLA